MAETPVAMFGGSRGKFYVLVGQTCGPRGHLDLVDPVILGCSFVQLTFACSVLGHLLPGLT